MSKAQSQSRQNLIVSRYSIYLMANPDATRQEFMLDTGGKIKDWYNSRDRVRGDTLRDRGVRLPHSKGIIYMMINPKATKEMYVKAGFSPENFVQNCIRARDLLIACNAAGSHISNLNKTLANPPKAEVKKAKKIVLVKKKPVALPDLPEIKPTPKPRLQTITEPTNCVDHSDLVLKIQSGVAELINELNEQQTEINTYRSRITTLNAENFRLRSEVAELTEMINGPSK